MAGRRKLGIGKRELLLVLRTEDERLTSLFGGTEGGLEVGNMGVKEPAFESATELFDCETAAEASLGLEGRLESLEEKAESRFSHVGCVTLEDHTGVSVMSSPAFSCSDAIVSPPSLECILRFKDLLLAAESVRTWLEGGSLGLAERRD